MATLPHIRLYRLGTAASLIVAPLLLLIDALPLLRMSDEQFAQGSA
jgi:hypothetical protein